MLAADQARFGGANLDLLWHAFARVASGSSQARDEQRRHRPGAGLLVAAREQRDAHRSAPPPTGNALPVKATIYVGDYQARATPIADTDPATATGGPGDRNPTPRRSSSRRRRGPLAEEEAPRRRTTSSPSHRATATCASLKDLHPAARDITSSSGRTSPRPLRARRSRPVTGRTEPRRTCSTTTRDAVGTLTGAPVAGRQVVVDLARDRARESNGERFLAAHARQQPLHRAAVVRALRLRAGKVAANATCDGSIDAGWTLLLSPRTTHSRRSTRGRDARPDAALLRRAGRSSARTSSSS